MKIIHVITTIDLGGAEKQLLILTKEQVKNGFHVELIYLKGKGELFNDFISNGVQVVNQIANKNLFQQIFFLRKISS